MSRKTTGVEQSPTGIQELDGILGGGFPRGHVVLVAGNSGTGKTMLSMEWLFKGYREEDESGLYLTLTESVTEAASNLAGLSFFDQAIMSESKVRFADLRSTVKLLGLEDTGVTKEDIGDIVDAIEELIEETGAKRVVIDSITALAYLMGDRDVIRTFIFRLGTMLASKDVTTILTSEVAGGEGYSVYGVEEFIADGIIKLEQNKVQGDLRRSLQVIKMRGTDYDSSMTFFDISEEGLKLFRDDLSLKYSWSEGRVPSGIPELDDLIGGGFKRGSATLLSGPAGSGKTLSCMQFVRQAEQEDERALFVSFEESESQLISMGKSFGWDLQQAVDDGSIRFLDRRPTSGYPEKHLSLIKELIQDDEIDRVVIDSLSAIRSVYTLEDFYKFARSLVLICKHEGATLLMTSSQEKLVGGQNATETNIGSLVDNILSFASFETRGKIKYSLTIMKSRTTSHSASIRSYTINSNGLSIGSEMKAYEGVLTGSATKVGKTVKEKLRSDFTEFLGPMGEQEFEQMVDKGISRENVKDYIESLVERNVLKQEKAEKFRERALSRLQE